MCYVATEDGLFLPSELFAKAARDTEHAAHTLINKALNPLNRRDFITITNQLHKRLSETALPPERAVVLQAIAALDIDWNALSGTQKHAAIDAFNQALSGLVPARLTAQPILVAEVTPLVSATKEATIQRYKLDIDNSFTRRDEAVARSVSGMQANFITDATGAIVADTTAWVRKTAGELAAQGLSSVEIAEALAAGVSAQTLGKASNYWRVVATSFVGRARTHEQLVAYTDAAIDYYVWESILDERTTEVCRFMHGIRFSTQASLERFRAAEAAVQSARGAQGVKDEQPWVTMTRNAEGKQEIVARTSQGQTRIATVDEPGYGEKDRIGKYSNTLDAPTLESMGLCAPPIHGMCRSTIVADV